MDGFSSKAISMFSKEFLVIEFKDEEFSHYYI